LARPSTQKPLTSKDLEHCWSLVGEYRGGIWYARRTSRTLGSPAQVAFDGPAILAREEQRHDVIGFLHTHPHCAATPSQRDIDTMQAWVSALGKPLLCVIEGIDGLAAYRFCSDDSRGEQVASVQKFARGVLIAVD
jgi:proteasome lid subunit RPN8/RPN11